MSSKSDALEQGSSLIRAAVTVALVLAIIVLIWFALPIAIFHSDEKVVEINDSNRNEVLSMIPEEIQAKEKYRGMDDAVSVDVYSTLTNEFFEIKYSDESIFLSKIDYRSPLLKYIKDNGYSAYFRSGKFTVDLLKLCVPLAAVVACGVYLKKTERKPEAQEENTDDAV